MGVNRASSRRRRRAGGTPEGADLRALFAPHCARADELLARLEAGLQASRAALADVRMALAPPARLTAALAFDNRRRPRTAGARAAGTETPRLLYRADGAAIDLELGDGAANGRLRVLGQVTADRAGLTPTRVVAEGPDGRAEAEVDELGQFVLDGLAAGRHRLEVGLVGATVEIADLEL
jgi:hypothetical protein